MNLIENTPRKDFLFLVILLLSNLAVYTISAPESINNSSSLNYLREDYVHIKIKAKSFVPFSYLKLIHLKNNNSIIAYGLLISENPETNEYILYVHDQFNQRILRGKKISLIPYSSKNKMGLKRRKQYEILIN